MDSVTKLFDFIKKSPTAYHAVNTVAEILSENGYRELFENEKFELSEGGKYFVKRNGSSLIAFRYSKKYESFMICASHSDSPSFKVKTSFSAGTSGTKLGVEKYGGMICYSWFDRPLSAAGRVFVKDGTEIVSRLVNFDRDLAVIPSLAIHMNRTVNDGFKINPAVDMLPIYTSGTESFSALLSREVGAPEEDIISHDIFLYTRDEGKLFGAEEELILSPRLDDLECVFASLQGFLTAKESAIPVLAVFDNEEVGSETKQGAASDFLRDTLSKIVGEGLPRMLPDSFMISSDNAHARHPNHPELSDPENAPVMNGGVVIKYNANQRYTTDAYSEAVLLSLAKSADVAVQKYSNRADMAGGSTLGSISNTRLALPTVDIGLAQLAMHSANESAGARDLDAMIKLLSEFYSSKIKTRGVKTEITKQ